MTVRPRVRPNERAPRDPGHHDAAVGSPQTGLPQMMSTRDPQKGMLTRENGRERLNEACYYASL